MMVYLFPVSTTITDRYLLKIVQVYAPTTSHSGEDTEKLYNTIAKILEKQSHYTADKLKDQHMCQGEDRSHR